MQSTNKAPFSLGMEIEQLGNEIPSGTTSDRHGLSWHRDGSGPMETTIGPFKSAKAILNRFNKATRDANGTWEWHAAGNDGRGAGCGSHVHLCVDRDVFEEAGADGVTAWTIGYNTVVEMLPFLAPYFCHDWERGFRHGNGSVRRWAAAETIRYSPETMEGKIANHYGRGYQSVTLNASRSKPLTIELRLNDAHPAMALPGAMILRILAANSVERGDSVKIAGDRNRIMDDVYSAIYNRAEHVGLMAAMREELPSGPICFEEGRGIPGVTKTEFATPFDVLKAVVGAHKATTPLYRYRADSLVQTGLDACSPENNPNALWNTDAPKGEFEWEVGPSDPGQPNVLPEPPEIEAETSGDLPA